MFFLICNCTSTGSVVVVFSLFLFGIAGKVAQEHAPHHAHQAGKGDLPLFGDETKEDHLGGDPKHQVFLPAGEKLAFHSI